MLLDHPFIKQAKKISILTDLLDQTAAPPISEPNSADVSFSEDINTVLQLRPENYDFQPEDISQPIEDVLDGQRVDTANYIGDDDEEDDDEDEIVESGVIGSSGTVAAGLRAVA